MAQAEPPGVLDQAQTHLQKLNESKENIYWIIKSLLPLYSPHKLVATAFIVSLLVNILARGDNISVITLHRSKAGKPVEQI